ncbi:hypothetical protein BRADI_5g06542v3 [Brachypodium distachyon]|uniref:Uncharacterized protein n=1 Tax=Brachypodium distachyon TaxID=15368 RepID=A0A0Q3E3B7_BRADI|nr:hypothetical protein BRADI_5g06542v3 [Brachypodium distachyon]
MSATMGKVLLLLLLFVVQLSSVLVAAARPLPLQRGHGGWMENGIEMMTQMLGGMKQQSGSNPVGHCC